MNRTLFTNLLLCSLLLLGGSITSNLFGQDELRLAHPLPADLKAMPDTKFKTNDHAGKNSALIDTSSGNPAFTIEITDGFVTRYPLVNPGPDANSCFVYYPYNEIPETRFRGYISGSMDTLLLVGGGDTTAVMLTEHGIPYNAPPRIDTGFYFVNEIFFSLTEGTVFRTSEEFKFYVYSASGNTINPQPIFEQPFNQNDLPQDITGSPIRVTFSYSSSNSLPSVSERLKANTRYFIMLETLNEVRSDDSLNLTYIQLKCTPPNYSPGVVSIRDPATWDLMTIRPFPQLFGLVDRDGQEAAFAPFIIPIIVTDGTPVSRAGHIDMGKAGGLQLFSAYPSPAVDFTNLRFNIDHNDQVAITIYDNQGRVVRKVEPYYAPQGENNYLLDTKDMSCGIYSFTIHTKQGSLGSRFMIER